MASGYRLWPCLLVLITRTTTLDRRAPNFLSNGLSPSTCLGGRETGGAEAQSPGKISPCTTFVKPRPKTWGTKRKGLKSARGLMRHFITLTTSRY